MAKNAATIIKPAMEMPIVNPSESVLFCQLFVINFSACSTTTVAKPTEKSRRMQPTRALSRRRGTSVPKNSERATMTNMKTKSIAPAYKARTRPLPPLKLHRVNGRNPSGAISMVNCRRMSVKNEPIWKRNLSLKISVGLIFSY